MAGESFDPKFDAIVSVRLTDGPIFAPADFAASSRAAATAGAVLMFQGCVRGREVIRNSREEPILGLEYQVYEPMTTRELQRLANMQAAKHGVIAVDVEHSFGFVGNGDCSFILQVAAAHRREAIAFIDEFIDEMKRHVPIWKVARRSAVQ